VKGPEVANEKRILELWERALRLSGFDREDALLAEGARERRLGERNVLLLRMRGELFGHSWSLVSTCPRCSENSEFVVDVETLTRELADTKAASGARAVVTEDVRAVAVLAEKSAVQRELFRRCIPGLEDRSRFDESEIMELARQLEDANPAAVVSFTMECTSCGHSWPATIDVGDALWREIERSAEQSIAEIGTLARSFGWSETEILALSATRRAAYLQVAEA
jgi:hypothetical protein